MYADANVIPHLISLMPHSTSNQISVATILTNACKTREHQTILANHGSVRAVNALLCSPYADVQLPALQWLTYLMFSNEQVSFQFKNQSLIIIQQENVINNQIC